MESLQEKICSTCHVSKILDAFSRFKHGKYGRAAQCRSCRSIQRKEQHRIWLTQEREVVEGTKTCRKCYATKDLTEFRDTVNGKRRTCRQCEQEISEEYHATHREEDRAYNIARYAADPEKGRKSSHDYYQSLSPEEKRALHEERHDYQAHYRIVNQDAVRAKDTAYRQAHPELYCTIRQRRRARITNAPINDLSTAQWEEILAAADYRCAYCPQDCKACKKKTHLLTPDHVTPYAHNGSNTLWNVVVCCKSCNSRKGARLLLPKPVQPLLLTLAPSRKATKQTTPSADLL
jgi:5-methylcytosine-specific restriction endonuclease McrA